MIRPRRGGPNDGARAGAVAGGAAWIALALAGAAGACAVATLDASSGGTLADRLDWQPALAAAQPWRAVTAAFVHLSRMHLLANLAGCVLVAALGVAAALPRRCALAWLAAWPLVQVALLLQPELAHYAGLSGVLHAGVAVAATHLAIVGPRRQRTIGLALLAGLVLKVASESPWAGPLRHAPGWDIAIAPLAHAAGLVAGAGCALLAEAGRRRGVP